MDRALRVGRSVNAADALAARLVEKTTFVDGGHVDCAVSGGADSLALLILARTAERDVTAWHVDHGLRKGSESEAEFVHAMADRFGAKFESRTVEVAAGPNVEARARAARFDVLPRGVLTGHTADDQAETVLINLLRGAGLDGLAGMRPDNKPLLELRRADTEALCEAYGIVAFSDPSNDDPSILRNRVRKELIPLMDQLAARDTRSVLARQARVVRDEVVVLDDIASRLDPTSARELLQAPQAVAMRALRNWLRNELDEEAHPPDHATILRAMRVVSGDVRASELPGGKRLVRSSQRLSVIDRSEE